jgi:hypothetical protein
MVMDEQTKEEVFEFLDDLRETGVTNMYGATSYIVAAFGFINKKTAGELLAEWMTTFHERHPEGA